MLDINFQIITNTVGNVLLYNNYIVSKIKYKIDKSIWKNLKKKC